MAQDNLMPVPALVPAFVLSLEAAERIHVGTLSTGGIREHVACRGGRIQGERLKGNVLAGHVGETWLRRADGVTVVDLHLNIRTDDGHTLRLTATGYSTEDLHFVGTRLSLLFEVDQGGPYEWLARTAFLAERKSGTEVFVIAEIA